MALLLTIDFRRLAGLTKIMILRISDHFRPVSLGELSRSWTQVWREIETLGFDSRKLESCQVRLGFVHTAYGYQWFGDRSNGRACGDIVLPTVSLSQWQQYFMGGKKESVTDILRHEYGHAFADVNRRRIETKRFEGTFGWAHDVAYDGGFEYDPEYHITEYAAGSTGEDFAETFWKYLKHKGRLPRQHHFKPIIKKWEFLESLRRS